jgi:hypothetical protein
MENPASPYLLDRLQARRANNSTTSRRSNPASALPPTDIGDDLFLNEAKSCGNTSSSHASTPNRSNSTINKNNPIISASSSLGAREMEKRMDKLSKLNFDLKLELFHCRERMAKLHENCKTLATKANRLVEENATLLELNDSLVKELEHRDEAVQEAVTIICELEDRLEHVQVQQQFGPPHSAVPNSTISIQRNDHVSPAASMQKQQQQQKRIPSFVVDKKPSTLALRSVYQDPTPTLRVVKSYASLRSHMHEDVNDGASDTDADALDSPRLSVLSESSFQSIYNNNKNKEFSTVEMDGSRLRTIARNAGTKRDYSDSDVNSWIQVHTPRSVNQSLGPSQHEQPHLYQDNSTVPPPQIRNMSSSTGHSTYGNGALLPPTPDSASTSLLQDSHISGNPHSRALQKIPANLANAAKHAALLHTPETLNPADMSNVTLLPPPPNNNQYTTMNGSAAAAGWSNRHSVSLSLTDEEEDEFYEQSSCKNGITNSNRTGSAGSDQVYPSGASIHKGTPSRFQVKRGISPAKNARFNDAVAAAAAVQDFELLSGKQGNGDFETDDLPYRRFRMERSETTPNLVVTELTTFASPNNLQPSMLQQQQQQQGKQQQQIPSQRMERSETTPNLLRKPHPFLSLAADNDVDDENQQQQQQRRRRRSRSFFQSGPPLDGMQSTGSAGKGVRAALSEKTHRLFRRMSEHGNHHHR